MFLAFKPTPSFPKMYEGLASTVAFDRFSGIAAFCTENYCVQLYNLLNDRGISEVRMNSLNILQPITKLCFDGKSELLVAASHSPKPELSVWNNTSKLSLSW